MLGARQAAPAATYDPFASEVIADPYPWYRQLHAEGGIHHVERTGVWALAGYDAVHAALRDHAALSSAEGVGFQRMGVPMMLTLDPPEHTRLRRIVSREFTPRSIESWRPIVERLAADAVGRLLEGGTDDFYATVAGPLPVAVIAGMLGLPESDLPALRRISDDIVEGFKLAETESPIARRIVGLLSNRRAIERTTALGLRFPRTTKRVIGMLTAIARKAEGEKPWSEDVARSTRAVSDLQAYCARLVRERRRRPGNDLVTKLIEPRDGERLSDTEVFWFFLLLLLAGHETTTNLLGNMVLALHEHPAEWKAVTADPSLVPSAVNEALRFDAPIQGFFRTARTAWRVGEAEIPEGSRVLLLFGAANRDPIHFPDPDVFRVERNPTDHLGFGTGIHYCLGAAVAELEGQAVLAELVRRVRCFEISGAIERTRNPTLRGIRRLPLRLEPR